MKPKTSTLLKRLAALEQNLQVNKPVMLVPVFEHEPLIWSLDAEREQAALKRSVRDGDVVPDYSGIVFPELVVCN